MNPYKVVEEFEDAIARYAGARHAVAVNSCTSAIMLAAALRFKQEWPHAVVLPSRTYVGVPQAILCAGGRVEFKDFEWSGGYWIEPLDIYDGARRFRRAMYNGGLHCLSFHWGKHLPIGRGGMILTNREDEAEQLRKMRHDGRTPGVPATEDTFTTPGWHVGMIPEDAARGLMLLQWAKDTYPDLPWDGYADLSKVEAFKGGNHA